MAGLAIEATPPPASVAGAAGKSRKTLPSLCYTTKVQIWKQNGGRFVPEPENS